MAHEIEPVDLNEARAKVRNVGFLGSAEVQTLCIETSRLIDEVGRLRTILSLESPAQITGEQRARELLAAEMPDSVRRSPQSLIPKSYALRAIEAALSPTFERDIQDERGRGALTADHIRRLEHIAKMPDSAPPTHRSGILWFTPQEARALLATPAQVRDSVEGLSESDDAREALAWAERSVEYRFGGYALTQHFSANAEHIATLARLASIKPMPLDAGPAQAALPPHSDIEGLREALRPFAEQRTSDELMRETGGLASSEWANASVERRIEMMGERRREKDANILRARTVLGGL